MALLDHWTLCRDPGLPIMTSLSCWVSARAAAPVAGAVVAGAEVAAVEVYGELVSAGEQGTAVIQSGHQR